MAEVYSGKTGEVEPFEEVAVAEGFERVVEMSKGGEGRIIWRSESRDGR